MDAEDSLLQSSRSSGSFLVRDCDTDPGDYILSVRDNGKVKHYQILSPNEGQYCISLRKTFKSVPDLISYHSQQAGGLCGVLKDPCVLLMQQRIISRWNIDRHNINFTKMIEPLEHYEVWSGDWVRTLVTIKIPKEGFVCIAKFYEEVELMKQLKHRNIIEFYGVCIQKNPLCITESTNCGNLQAYLTSKGYNLTNHDLVDMGIQVASAMLYLEEKKCVHRNLQAVNIMLQSSKSFICKLANFTYARFITKHDYVESALQEKFPVKWTAPESLRTKRFTLKSDVWSFGIVLYELITCGNDPYPGYPELHEKKRLLRKLDTGYRMSCPIGCPGELYEIMKECWRDNADNRPTFWTVRQKLGTLLFNEYS